MTQEEILKSLQDTINAKMQGVASAEEIKGIKETLDTLKSNSDNTEIKSAVAGLEAQIKQLKEQGTKNEEKSYSLGETIVKTLSEKLDAFKAEGRTISLETKTTINADYSGTQALTTLEPGVSRIARKPILLQTIVNVANVTSKYIKYISQTLVSSVGMIAEGGAKTLGNVQYEEVSVEVKKIAGIIKVSKEMLEDLAFMQNEINTDLMASVREKLEEQLLTGDGTGNNMTGILELATTFDAGTFAGTIVDANVSDVIRVAAAQVEEGNFFPTHVVLRPADLAKIQLTKTSTGEYTYPIFLTDPLTGTQSIYNLIVVSSNFMPDDTLLVADMTKSNLRVRENMNITVGYNADDFSKNMVSIICEARAAHYIKDNDVRAFVTADISTAIAALLPA
jgi:HK97 family phage major capsid protein